MKKTILLAVLGVLLFRYSVTTGDPAKEERARLEGTWVLTTAVWGGEPLSLTGKEKQSKPITWTFAGDRFQSFVGLEDGSEEGTYKVDSGKMPKHLDLLLSKGEVLTTRKCVYSLMGDELKIAFTLWFSPGTPEQEIEQAKKMRTTRPKSLTKPDDVTCVLTLKRSKK